MRNFFAHGQKSVHSALKESRPQRCCGSWCNKMWMKIEWSMKKPSKTPLAHKAYFLSTRPVLPVSLLTTDEKQFFKPLHHWPPLRGTVQIGQTMSKATGPREENVVVRKICTSKAQGGIGLIRRVPLALVREGVLWNTIGGYVPSSRMEIFKYTVSLVKPEKVETQWTTSAQVCQTGAVWLLIQRATW